MNNLSIVMLAAAISKFRLDGFVLGLIFPFVPAAILIIREDLKEIRQNREILKEILEGKRALMDKNAIRSK